MNGPHDLGGRHGLGSIEIEADEPVFHAEWERRVFAMTLACGALGEWNLDKSRHAREDTDPVTYLSSSYYQTWLRGLTRLLQESDLVSEAERTGGPVRQARPTRRPVPDAAATAKALARGSSTRRDDGQPGRFALGEQVRARNIHPRGHTRVPGYVRGRIGRIERDHGLYVFADANASGLGEQPQHVYAVRFEATELWGPDGDTRGAVFVDLWDSHLEAAT